MIIVEFARINKNIKFRKNTTANVNNITYYLQRSADSMFSPAAHSHHALIGRFLQMGRFVCLLKSQPSFVSHTKSYLETYKIQTSIDQLTNHFAKLVVFSLVWPSVRINCTTRRIISTGCVVCRMSRRSTIVIRGLCSRRWTSGRQPGHLSHFRRKNVTERRSRLLVMMSRWARWLRTRRRT